MAQKLGKWDPFGVKVFEKVTVAVSVPGRGWDIDEALVVLMVEAEDIAACAPFYRMSAGCVEDLHARNKKAGSSENQTKSIQQFVPSVSVFSSPSEVKMPCLASRVFRTLRSRCQKLPSSRTRSHCQQNAFIIRIKLSLRCCGKGCSYR